MKKVAPKRKTVLETISTSARLIIARGRYTTRQMDMGVLMNIVPFPMGGSIFTVSPAVYRMEKSWEVTDAADLRHIIDFSDRENSLRIMAGGMSGNSMIHPLRQSGRETAKLWLNYKYRPFVLDRESVEKDVKYTLIMKPE